MAFNRQKAKKIATLCIIIACLDDEEEGIRKKGPDRNWLRRRAEWWSSPVPELYFLPAPYTCRGWTRAGKRRIQDNLHAYAQNAAIFSPKQGKNHIWKYFPDFACGAIFWMIIYKQQFLHSDWLTTCQLIPDQWNFISATPNHIRFVFFFNHIIKDNERNLCQDLLTIENTDSDLKVHALHYANELLVRVRLSKTFAKSLNQQKQYEKNVWEKSNDA